MPQVKSLSSKGREETAGQKKCFCTTAFTLHKSKWAYFLLPCHHKSITHAHVYMQAHTLWSICQQQIYKQRWIQVCFLLAKKARQQKPKQVHLYDLRQGLLRQLHVFLAISHFVHITKPLVILQLTTESVRACDMHSAVGKIRCGKIDWSK